jgi:hypothetical protein
MVKASQRHKRAAGESQEKSLAGSPLSDLEEPFSG